MVVHFVKNYMILHREKPSNISVRFSKLSQFIN